MYYNNHMENLKFNTYIIQIIEKILKENPKRVNFSTQIKYLLKYY